MVFTDEQAETIKQQLLTQVENLPNENKEQIKQYILGLSGEGLEEFLKKNNIQIAEGGQVSQGTPSEGEASPSPVGQGECIFCAITQDKIPYYKVDENPKSLAILEINPVSKGHSIVLPKEHLPIEKISKSALGLAQKVAKKIRAKLKSEDVKIETSSFMGHAMVNVIPLYKGVQLQKKKAEESELKEVQSALETKKRGPKKSTSTKASSKLPKISFRIP